MKKWILALLLAALVLLGGCAQDGPEQPEAPRAEAPHREQFSGVITELLTEDGAAVAVTESAAWGVKAIRMTAETRYEIHYTDTGETVAADSSMLRAGAQVVITAELGGDRDRYPAITVTCFDLRGGEDPGSALFSWEQVRAQYPAGTPGVQTEGFVNSEPLPPLSEQPATLDLPEQARDRAAAECRVAYDTARMAHDPDTGVWAVSFRDAGAAGGGLTVYLSREGVTLLTVAGE